MAQRINVSILSWFQSKSDILDFRRFWKVAENLPDDDESAGAILTTSAQQYHPELSVNIRRSFRNNRLIVFFGKQNEQAHDTMLLLLRNAPTIWSHGIILDMAT